MAIDIYSGVAPAASYGIYEVDFYADGTLIGRAFAPPYRISHTFAPGTYTIVVRAIDTSGLPTDAPPVTITVVANDPDVVYYYKRGPARERALVHRQASRGFDGALVFRGAVV